MTDINKLNEHISKLRVEPVAQHFYFWKHCLELNQQGQLEAGFLMGLYESHAGNWHEIIRRVLSDRHVFHANDLFPGMAPDPLLDEYSPSRIAQSLWLIWSLAAPVEGAEVRPRVEEFVAACLLVWTSNKCAWPQLMSWARNAATKFETEFIKDLQDDLWVESENFGRRRLPMQWPGAGEFNVPTEVSFWLALHAIEVAYEKIDNIIDGTRSLGAFSLPPARENCMPKMGPGPGKLWRHMAACASAWEELLRLLFAFNFQERKAARTLAPIDAAHGQDLFVALVGTRQVGKTTVVKTLQHMCMGDLVHVGGVPHAPATGLNTQVSFVTELQSPEHGNPRLRCADVAGEDLIDATGKPPATLGSALKNRPPAAFLVVLDPNTATQQEHQLLALAQVNRWQLNNLEAGKFPIPIVILINKIDQWKVGNQRWIDFAINKAKNAKEMALAPEFFDGSFARMEFDKALSEQPAYREQMNKAIALFGIELDAFLNNNPHARVYFSVATEHDCHSLQEAWSYLQDALIKGSRSNRAKWKSDQIDQLRQQVWYFKLLDSLGSYLISPPPTTPFLAGNAGSDLAHGIRWLLHGLSDLEVELGLSKTWVEMCHKRLLKLSQRLEQPPPCDCKSPKWNMNSLLDHLLEDLGIRHKEEEKFGRVPNTIGNTGQFTSSGGEINEVDAWKPVTGCSRTRCAFEDNGKMFAAADMPDAWPAGDLAKNLLTNDWEKVVNLKSRIGYLVNQRSAEKYQDLRLPQFALQKGSTDLARIMSLKTVFPEDPRAGWVAELLDKMKKWTTPVNGLRPARLIAAECFISLGALAHKRGTMMRAVTSLIPGTADYGLRRLKLNREEWQHLAAPAASSTYTSNRYLFGMELKSYSSRMCRHLALVEAVYYKRTKWLQEEDLCEPPGRSHFPDVAVDDQIDDGLESLEAGFSQGGIQRPGLIQLLEEKLNV